MTLPIGGKAVAIPLVQAGSVSQVRDPNLNLAESFTVTVVNNDRRRGMVSQVSNAANGSTTFDKPVDNIGTKTIADYPVYAGKHIYSVNVPGCSRPAKLFVGQRRKTPSPSISAQFSTS